MRKYKFHGEKLVFREGLAAFNGSKGIGFVNKSGEIVIKPQFRDIGHGPLEKGFVNGLCKASYRRCYGFINKDGEFVIPPIYTNAQPFREGLAAVLQEDKVIYITPNGQRAFNREFSTFAPFERFSVFAGDFHEGLANAFIFAHEKLVCGYIDKTGEFVIKPEFDWLGNQYTFFSDGVAIMRKDDNRHYGILDREGNYFENRRFDYSDRYFEKGIDGIRFRYGRKYGLIDKNANIIVEPIYEEIRYYNEKYLLVKFEGCWKLIDRLDNRIQDYPGVEFKSRFIDGLALVSYNKLFGFIDITGQFIIEPTLTNAQRFSDGVAQVEIDGKWGLINTKGEKIAGF